MIGVARHAVADQLGIDFGAARLGPLIFLEHDHARALAHDEAVAILVIGTRSLLGLVVEVGGQRPRLGETSDAQREERALGAAGQRSEERRVGTAGVRTGRSRGPPSY